MLLPRSIIFGLESDREFLQQLSEVKKSDPYYCIFKHTKDIYLSGPKNQKLSHLIEDTGAYWVFLPHPDSDPLRRKITRAVIKSLTNNIPRIVELKFYNTETNKVLSYVWDGRKENFFPMLPKVSVIVRSGGSSLLKDALNSISNQSYDHLEVILVQHGPTKNIEEKFFHNLDIKIINGVQDRGKNLNIGVDAADGQYIGFLDEDDLIMRDHFKLLVTSLESDKRFPVAYSNTVLSRWNIEGERTIFDGVVKTFSQEFNSLSLLFENFIPLNSLLIKKEVFLFERFPEGIGAYEDWVFLSKLALRGIRFLHVDHNTAEYRIFEKDLYTAHEKKGFVKHSDEAAWLFLTHLNLTAYNVLKKDYLAQKERISLLEKKIKLLEEKLKNKDSNRDYASKKVSSTPPTTPSIHVHDSKECDILISAKDTPKELFERLINSIKHQINYPVKLYILDDGSISPLIEKKVKKIRKDLGEQRVYFERTNGLGISRAYNLLAERSNNPFMLFCDHDDELTVDVLENLLGPITHKTKLIYSDSDVIDVSGNTLLVHNKPDWSPDTLLSFNYINHPMVISRTLWEEVGGFRSEFDGAQDWDFLLRATNFLSPENVIHINKVLYHWRAVPGSVAMHPKEKPWAVKAGEKALLSGIKMRIGGNINLFQDIYLEPNPYGPGFLKRFLLNREGSFPKIRIVIPTLGNVFRINQILEVLGRTTYPNLCITIISNGKKKISPKDISSAPKFDIEVINIEMDEFNWSFMNNFAVKDKKEDLFLFLNDDILPDDDFISNMFFTYLITGAKVIGGVLFFPSLALQHNGIKTDEEVIGHEIRETGTSGELAVLRNVSGVTGAAMLTTREVFLKTGGFEQDLGVNYNDVDYCLKVRERGFNVVLSYEAQAIHFHMATRKNPFVSKKEIDFMRKKWGNFLKERYFYRWDKKTSTSIKMTLK